MDRVDVAVVGLGAMGALTLWRLASRGVSAAGYDSFDPPHDRGSSHGDSRIIRTAYAEGAFHVPLVQEAWGLWRELEAATGKTLLTPTGALMIGPPGSELSQGTLASAIGQTWRTSASGPAKVTSALAADILAPEMWRSTNRGRGCFALRRASRQRSTRPRCVALRCTAIRARRRVEPGSSGRRAPPRTRRKRRGPRVRAWPGRGYPRRAPQLVTSLRVERQVNACGLLLTRLLRSHLTASWCSSGNSPTAGCALGVPSLDGANHEARRAP